MQPCQCEVQGRLSHVGLCVCRRWARVPRSPQGQPHTIHPRVGIRTEPPKSENVRRGQTARAGASAIGGWLRELFLIRAF